MKNISLNKLLPYFAAIITFIAIILVYCYSMLEGKVINQQDVRNWEGMAHEARQFEEETGEATYWTNSMFSGMPTYQITMPTPANKFLSKLYYLFQLYLPSVMGIMMGYFIGFFILMRSFGINKWMSIIGSIAIAFSSYFFIILAAGHNSKAEALGFLAPIAGGFFLIFRKKYFWGIPLVILYSCLSIVRHPQMTYYIFLMLGVFGIAELFIHIKEKRYKDLLVSLIIFAAAVGIGAGTRYGVIKANSEYLKETMRGGHSELTSLENTGGEPSTGLDIEYATSWSYSTSETMTLMIPNFMGGSSHYNLGKDSDVYKELVRNGVPKSQANDILKGLPMYWGKQPFTSGPVYVGAIICFLFVLGLFIVKGPYKWALLTATIFSILLSWGNNFMWLTELFFNYFPMYNKFRAVASILVIAEITMPLLGFLAIKTIMDKKADNDKIIKSIFYSAGITAGICLIFALFGGALFTFSGASDAQLPEWLSGAIISERVSMLKSDAFRSLLFIVACALVLWLYVNNKLKFGIFTVLLGALVLIDMGPVNKRYFGDEHFVTKKQYDSYFAKQPYEEQLLKDSDPNFRVINLTTDVFNDSRTSYYLKSIGGYHGAKLRRYQDLISEHISKNNMSVLNMLNTKYFIVKGQDNRPIVQLNSNAMGNAWFIDTLLVVNNPDEESDALHNINMHTTAVVDVKFADLITQEVTPYAPQAHIKLASYAPNALEYNSSSSVDKTAVFSEIYYPYGWKAYIDDKPVEHFRVNYALRALNIPAGEHNIKFEFKPDTIYKGERVSFAFIAIMIISVSLCIAYPLYRKRKQINN